MDQEERDQHYMRRALQLAKRGEGRTSPNPMVGAVIVKNGMILGEGYHQAFGGPHAEINAIRQAHQPLDGASFYVTLEPCTHFGKTPPCIESVLKTRPAEVIIGTADPNPIVSGKSIVMLKRAGITTRIGILEEDCRRLNEKFFKFISTSIPFTTVKFAQTLDGRIAAASRDSKWISSEASRKMAHRERALHDAVLVGVGTVLADNPELTVRLSRGRNPIRIVIDSTLRIPLDARILQNCAGLRTILVTTPASESKNKFKKMQQLGMDLLTVDQDQQGRVDLKRLLPKLAERQISSILVEGGSETITSFLKKQLADRLLVFTAPKILGRGIEAIGDLGIDRIQDAIDLDICKAFRSGGDIVVDARLRSGSKVKC